MRRKQRALGWVLACLLCLLSACDGTQAAAGGTESVLPGPSERAPSDKTNVSGEVLQTPQKYAAVEEILAQHPDNPEILQKIEPAGYEERFALVETRLEVDWLQTDYPLNRWFLVDRLEKTCQELFLGAGVNELQKMDSQIDGVELTFLVYGPYTPGSGQYYAFPRTVRGLWQVAQGGGWKFLSEKEAYLPIQTPARMGTPEMATLALAEIDISFDRVQLVCHGMSPTYEHGMLETYFDEESHQMVLRLLSRPGDTPAVQFSKENSLISSVDIRWEETNRKDRQEGVWEIRLGLVSDEQMTYHVQTDQTIQLENEQGPELYQAIGIHFLNSSHML